MSVHGSDISWHMLRRIVQDWIGTAAELTEVEPLAGGCINTTLALTTSTGDRAVLKVSPHRVDRNYVHEAYQLNTLRSLGLPDPLHHELEERSFDAAARAVAGDDAAPGEAVVDPPGTELHCSVRPGTLPAAAVTWNDDSGSNEMPHPARITVLLLPPGDHAMPNRGPMAPMLLR